MEQAKKKFRKHWFLTGEDIDMLNERKRDEKRKREVPICDRHIDGA